MRRTDRQCDDSDFLTHVMGSAVELHLAFAGADMPYVLPLNFASLGKALYIHCAPKGRKMELLAKDDRVGFSMCCDVEVNAAQATTYYSSVCGNGRICVVTDTGEKMRALTLLAEKYKSPCAPTSAEGTTRVAVLRVDIAEITGKRLEKK